MFIPEQEGFAFLATLHRQKSTSLYIISDDSLYWYVLLLEMFSLITKSDWYLPCFSKVTVFTFIISKCLYKSILRLCKSYFPSNFFLFFSLVLGLKLKIFPLLGRCSTLLLGSWLYLSHTSTPFCSSYF
jgi:hypothetical protein